MIVLYQYPGIARGATLSPPCAKVQMALAYKALAYRVHDCSTPMEVKRVNPRGRVPALRIDDAIVVDSSDILSHLDVIQPAPPLMPDSQQDQAMAQVLEDWADEALYFYGLYLRWCTPDGFARMKSVVLSKMPFPVRLIVPVIARRETAKRSRAQGVGLKDRATVLRELGQALDALDTLAGSASGFLAGPRFSRADIAVAAVIDQLRIDELSPEGASLVAARPRIAAWLERVHARVPDAARGTPALR